jgi:3-oxoadipate enol-lactonase
MAFADLQDSAHHYLLEGAEDKPVLVFSNSLGTDLRIWDTVVAQLRARFRILRYDKRGHGLSDTQRPPYSADELAQDLLGLLDLLDIRAAVICGISVGGLIAQRLALAHPDRVRALVLCDTGARIGSVLSWEERIALVKSSGLQAVVRPSMERWFTQRYRAHCGTEVRGYSNMLRRQSVDGYVGTCFALRDADLRQEVSRIQLPTLVLCGDQDVATPPDLGRELARLIPRAHFSLIEQAAHLPCIEQPRAMVSRMTQFFKEVQIV